MFFLLLHDAFFDGCNLNSGATYSPKNTVITPHVLHVTMWPPCVSAVSYLRNVLLCPNSCPPLWAMFPLIWESPPSPKSPVWGTPASRVRRHRATATGTAPCGAPGALRWTATSTVQGPASLAQWTAATPATAPTSATGWLQRQQQRAWAEPPCQVSAFSIPVPVFSAFSLNFIIDVLLNFQKFTIR